jgi:hypothetical protein
MRDEKRQWLRDNGWNWKFRKVPVTTPTVRTFDSLPVSCEQLIKPRIRREA